MLVPTNKGYDTNAAKRTPRKPNGWLTYNGDEVPIWVQEVTIDFSMSGQTAQSSRTRTFFAHNFQQPAFGVSCQFPNQEAMAEVAQLVRRSHKGLESSMLLEILGKVGPTNRNLKGASQNLAAEGYVLNFAREHMQHIYAPDVTFAFTVERMISPGEWSDTPVKIRKLKSWHDIVESVMMHDPNAGFTADPDANIPRPAGDPTPITRTPTANGPAVPIQ